MNTAQNISLSFYSISEIVYKWEYPNYLQMKHGWFLISFSKYLSIMFTTIKKSTQKLMLYFACYVKELIQSHSTLFKIT